MTPPPFMNSLSPQNWESDRAIAKEEIIAWLIQTTSTAETRSLIEARITSAFAILESTQNLTRVIGADPSILTALRALTRRDIGTSQIATFLGVSTSLYEAIENGSRSVQVIASQVEDLLRRELDESLAPWILENRVPTESERTRSIIVAADRILRRSTSTELRYKHEPRQLEKLKNFLESRGFHEVQSNNITDPRADMSPGTFAFRVNIEGTTIGGVPLKQSVDTLIMPTSTTPGLLPIFLEAKSMTDEVNPNKRQKEEAQKVDNVRRRWQTTSEKLNFILLLGGTVPRRYLEVEAGSGLDWIWEHRVEDLAVLLDWYLTQ